MTHSAVATRYANALADVVTTGAGAAAEATLGELRAFESVLRSSSELQNALISPAVPPSRKRAVVGRLADTLKLSRVTRNFLFVLIDHRRIASLADIVQSFETVADEGWDSPAPMLRVRAKSPSRSASSSTRNWSGSAANAFAPVTASMIRSSVAWWRGSDPRFTTAACAAS
jgi:hypothetical protein